QAKKRAAGQVPDNEHGSNEPGAVEIDKPYSKKAPTPTMVLAAPAAETSALFPPPASNAPSSESESQAPLAAQTIPAATRCKILLLGDVSASKSKPGDVVRARLLDPLVLE